MHTVISASRRTDIPAFYLPWFMEKIKQGYVDVPNPLNRKQVKRVSLSPKDVGWIVFWSRNFGPFLKHHSFFSLYHLYFHFTINPPDALLEPQMLPPSMAFKQLEKLVQLYGPELIVWRYDPLVFYIKNGEMQTNHRISIFRDYLRIASSLGLNRCYISIAHIYPKMLRRARTIPNFEFVDPAMEQKMEILTEMVDVASIFGIQLYSCSNRALLKVEGLKPASCINGRLLNRYGIYRVSERHAPTRSDCGCTASVDIGDYVKTPCKYRCLYCYARP